MAVGWRTSYALVIKSQFADGGDIEQVTAVEDDLVLQGGNYLQKVGSSEFVPLRGDDQGIGAIEGFILIFGIGDLVADELTDIVHGFGVEYAERGAFRH